MTRCGQTDLPGIDTNRAHPARVYNYLLGGKDNYEADREAAEAMVTHVPGAPMMARANRAFLRRAVRHLVRDRGVTQLLDIGAGLPAACNTHEIAHGCDPTARVVYVDNDPLVAAHARALLATDPAGRTAFVLADVTRPAEILTAPELSATLDLNRPVALLLVSVLMYFEDGTVREVLPTLVTGLPAGGYLVVSHPTADFAPDAVTRAVKAADAAGLTCIPRTRAQVEALFSGLELVEPGVVPMLAWRPDLQSVGRTRDPNSVYYWVGMARTRH